MIVSQFYCCFALILGLLSPIDKNSDSYEEGAIALTDTWYVAGGCAAGTGASLTKPLQGPIKLAWKHEPSSKIIGEPLVWNNLIVFETKPNDKNRTLHLLDLTTGSQIDKKTFKTALPLFPSIWGSVVIVRSKEKELTALRMNEARFKNYRRIKFEFSVTAPLLFRNEVYFGERNVVTKYDLQSNEVKWRSGTEFDIIGRPALRGSDVYFLGFEFGDNIFHLSQHDRKDGKNINSHYICRATSPPGYSSPFQISIYKYSVVIHSPTPMLPISKAAGNDDELKFNHIGFERFNVRHTMPRFEPPWIFHKVAAAEMNEWGLALIKLPKEGRMWINYPGDLLEDASNINILAGDEIHPELADLPADPALLKKFAYLSGHGVDLSSYRILWKLPEKTTERMIPCRNFVLSVNEKGALSAYTTFFTKALESSSKSASQDNAVVTYKKGVAVPHIGPKKTVRSFQLNSKERSLQYQKGKKEAFLDLNKYLVVETDRNEIVYAANPDKLLRGLKVLINEEMSQNYIDLANKACNSNDPELIARFSAKAELMGVPSNKLSKVTRALKNLERRPLSIKRNIVNEVLKMEKGLNLFMAEAYWKRVQAFSEEQRGSVLFFTVLRAVLETDETHEKACKLVSELVPDEIKIKGNYNIIEWLGFAETLKKLDISFIQDAKDNDSYANEAQILINDAERRWRPDLVAFQSNNLIILTPVIKPGSIAKCLLLGEQVCSQLEKMIPLPDTQETSGKRLRLHLCESQDEFLKQLGVDKNTAGAALSAAGCYSTKEHLSRIFVPENERAFQEVSRTYAHELTHHWLADKVGGDPQRAILRHKSEGFWIVEGFASFVEEFRFDPQSGGCITMNPQSNMLDILANMKSNGKNSLWCDWRHLFKISAINHHNQVLQKKVSIPSTWLLGAMRGNLNLKHLFYAQSAATCSYLYHAEDGKYRDQLIAYIKNFYEMNTKELDVKKAFNMSYEELGRRVREFAIESQKIHY